MREYGQVQSAFWQSPDAQHFSDTGKLLAVYLLTGPHTNGIGCFRLPDGYVMADLAWTQERVSEGFLELSEKGFANRFDGVVFVPNFLRWNRIANVNIAKARFGEFETLPKGEAKNLVARAMLEFCPHWDDAHKAVIETVCQTVSKGYANQNPTQPNPEKKEPNTAQQAERLFDECFWPAYPRKVGRENAVKAFVKLKPSGELLKVMLKALSAQSSSEQWRKDRQFIPHPATWLNGKRWQDEADAGGNYPGETPDYLVGAI